jgi:hypothetical protein
MLWTAFILGLLGSFHCIGMCGPIAFMLPVDRGNSFKKALQIFTYHFGRLFTYSLLGLIFGLLGKSFYLFGFQQQLSIFIGIMMIVFVVFPSRLINKYNFSKPIYKLISRVRSSLGKALKKKTLDTFFTIGFLNGFLPCGLVYMAIFGSLVSSNIIYSGFYMMFFGLGTVPLMTVAVYLGKFLSTTIKQRIQQAIPVFVVIIGVLFILRGLGLGIPYISPLPVVEIVTNNIDCN